MISIAIKGIAKAKWVKFDVAHMHSALILTQVPLLFFCFLLTLPTTTFFLLSLHTGSKGDIFTHSKQTHHNPQFKAY